MNGVRLRFLRRRESRVIRGAHAKAGAALAAAPPLPAPVTRPAAVVGESLFDRSDASPEQPTFTRRPPAPPLPAPVTRPAAVGGQDSRPRTVRPYVSAGAQRPVLFEKLAAELPLPPVMSAGDRARLLGRPDAPESSGPGVDVELYSAPGWTGALATRRVRNGEWDDWLTAVERGLGQNAADEATALRHSRQRVAQDWRLFCLAVGRRDWIDPGLDRIRELAAQGRQDAEIPAARAS